MQPYWGLLQILIQARQETEMGAMRRHVGELQAESRAKDNQNHQLQNEVSINQDSTMQLVVST